MEPSVILGHVLAVVVADVLDNYMKMPDEECETEMVGMCELIDFCSNMNDPLVNGEITIRDLDPSDRMLCKRAIEEFLYTREHSQRVQEIIEILRNEGL
jgi:hypothetical protein